MRQHKISAIRGAESVITTKLFLQLASSNFLLFFVAEPLIFQGLYL